MADIDLSMRGRGQPAKAEEKREVSFWSFDKNGIPTARYSIPVPKREAPKRSPIPESERQAIVQDPQHRARNRDDLGDWGAVEPQKPVEV